MLPLCHFFLIYWDGQNRLSPSPALWDDCFTEVPRDTFFLVPHFSCFQWAAIFLKLYELVTNLFLSLHSPSSPLLLLSHLTAWTHIQHLPHKPTVHLCPSACLRLSYGPPFYFYLTLLNSWQATNVPGTIIIPMFSLYCSLRGPSCIQCTHVNKDNKKNRKRFSQAKTKKVFALTITNEMQLQIEWPHNSPLSTLHLPPTTFEIGPTQGVVCMRVCVSNSFVTAFLNPNPPCTRGNGGLWQRQGSFTVHRAEC